MHHQWIPPYKIFLTRPQRILNPQGRIPCSTYIQGISCSTTKNDTTTNLKHWRSASSKICAGYLVNQHFGLIRNPGVGRRPLNPIWNPIKTSHQYIIHRQKSGWRVTREGGHIQATKDNIGTDDRELLVWHYRLNRFTFKTIIIIA